MKTKFFIKRKKWKEWTYYTETLYRTFGGGNTNFIAELVNCTQFDTYKKAQDKLFEIAETGWFYKIEEMYVKE